MMKKTGIIILIIALFVLAIFSACSTPAVSYNKRAMTENVKVYSDFARFCQQCFDGNDKNYSYYYNAENHTLFCNTTDQIFQMDKEQAEAAQTVRDTPLIGEPTLENI